MDGLSVSSIKYSESVDFSETKGNSRAIDICFILTTEQLLSLILNLRSAYFGSFND